MPTEILKEQVRDLLSEGAQIIEVLSAKQYQKQHIAGALNIPLEDLDRAAVDHLSKSQPIITYCYDFL